MNISPELLYAILAMDSYNRGYDEGIVLPDAKGTAIGPAKISDRIQDFEGFASQAEAAGFYASAYEVDGAVVISYRGTDKNIALDTFWSDAPGSDLWNGYGTFLGSPLTEQARLAAEFYQSVTDTDGGEDV